ncbi:hypothetical protein Bca4012_018809 [Brassica carinata]
MEATKAPSLPAHVSGGWFGFFSNASSVLSPGGTGFHSLASSTLMELSAGPPKVRVGIRGRNDGDDAQEKKSGGSRLACLGFDAIQSQRRSLWLDGTPRREDGALWRSCESVAVKSRRATRVSLLFQISTRVSIPSLLDARTGQAVRFPSFGP